VAFWARNEARGIVILCEQRVTKPKAPPNEPAGQRLAALSAALVLDCVESLHGTRTALHKPATAW